MHDGNKHGDTVVLSVFNPPQHPNPPGQQAQKVHSQARNTKFVDEATLPLYCRAADLRNARPIRNEYEEEVMRHPPFPKGAKEGGKEMLGSLSKELW